MTKVISPIFLHKYRYRYQVTSLSKKIDILCARKFCYQPFCNTGNRMSVLIIRYFKYQTHKNSGTFQGVLRTKLKSRVVQDFQGAYKACLRLEKLEMVSTEFNLYHFIDQGYRH